MTDAHWQLMLKKSKRMEDNAKYVEENWEAQLAGCDASAAIKICLDTAVIYAEMLILGRDAYDEEGIMDEDFRELTLDAKAIYMQLEKRLNQMHGYGRAGQCISRVMDAATQTDPIEPSNELPVPIEDRGQEVPEVTQDSPNDINDDIICIDDSDCGDAMENIVIPEQERPGVEPPEPMTWSTMMETEESNTATDCTGDTISEGAAGGGSVQGSEQAAGSQGSVSEDAPMGDSGQPEGGQPVQTESGRSRSQSDEGRFWSQPEGAQGNWPHSSTAAPPESMQGQMSPPGAYPGVSDDHMADEQIRRIRSNWNWFKTRNRYRVQDMRELKESTEFVDYARAATEFGRRHPVASGWCCLCDTRLPPFGRAHLHHCRVFRNQDRVERIVWVEALGLCHNCFTHHYGDHCEKPTGCSCQSGRCQCGSSHKHNSMLCGGRRRMHENQRPR